MKVKFTRPSPAGFGAPGTETKVEELPDTDNEGHATIVPDGAAQVDESTVAHDWARVIAGGFPAGGN